MTAASGADQPTLRDQLGQQVLITLLRTDNEPNSGKLAIEVADVLLPVIEADRERAKAEALEEARWAVHVLRFNADEDPDHRWPPGSPKAVPTYYAGVVRAERELRERAAALRGEK